MNNSKQQGSVSGSSKNNSPPAKEEIRLAKAKALDMRLKVEEEMAKREGKKPINSLES